MNDYDKSQAEKQPMPTNFVGLDNCAKVLLMEQLMRQAKDLEQRHGRTVRMIETLRKHPEFEEFIDFQELLQRRNF